MKLFFLSLSLLALFTSCNHKYYAPNSANLPLLSDKGEARINLLYSTGAGSEFNGGEFQMAYALTDCIGIMANGFTARKSELVQDWGPFAGPARWESGRGSYTELASGYFKRVPAGGIFEIYGGIGFGNAINDYGNGQLSGVDVTKFFIQPAIGYKLKFVEVGFSPRVSLLKWRPKTGAYVLAEDMITVYENPELLLMEPGFLLRTGFKNIKLQFSASYSAHLNASFDARDLTERVTFGIGSSVNFNTSKRKAK